jgi:gluconolactonase
LPSAWFTPPRSGNLERPPPKLDIDPVFHEKLAAMKYFALLSTLCASTLACAAADGTSLAAPGAKLEKLAGDFAFTEGPACDAKGNVFFTDQPNDRILKWSIDGQLSTWLTPSGRANGLCFDAQGNLWACADGRNELWKIAPDGTHTVILARYQTNLFNGPNDLWIAPNGTIYFTDPFYKRPYWERGASEMSQCVYRLAKGATEAVRIIDDLTQPNGIIGTPDGKTLYVADIKARKTYRYAIRPDGAVEGKTLFCEMGSDGLTIDDRGNIYLTGKGVTVFSPEGAQLENIPVPEGWTANVCFGGADRQTLFITASKGLYSLRMRVKGVDSQ